MNDRKKTKKQLIDELAALRKPGVEEALRERIKELHCLYAIADCIEKTDSLEDLFCCVVNQIPSGWYYPEQACARITFQDREYKTANFQETMWKLPAAITMQGEPLGVVEVRYLEKMPDRDEGPFLEEERTLLQAIAERLGRVIERSRMERALRDSEAKFREIFETIEDLYYETDKEGLITILSPSLHRLSDWGKDDLIGKPVVMVYANPGARERLLREILEKGRVNDYEISLKKKDGSILTVSLSARPILDDHGQPVGIRGLLRDMTGRKHIEEERERLISQLRKALAEIKKLSGLLPICSSCKKIRDDKGYWKQIESYIREHSEANSVTGFALIVSRGCIRTYTGKSNRMISHDR